MFQYLMTDARVVGIVGWIGTLVGIVSLAITIVGFWIALAQLRRVKRAAEAAETAVATMTNVVKDRERSARLTHALSQLRIARTYLPSNPAAAAAYLDTGCSSILEARELAMPAADQDTMLTRLGRLRKIERDLRPQPTESISNARLKTYDAEIQDTSIELETMVAKIRFSYDTIKVIS